MDRLVTVTVKISKKNEYLRLPKSEAEQLVRKGKARFVDKSEWRRWVREKGEG